MPEPIKTGTCRNPLTIHKIINAQMEMETRLANADWFRRNPDPRNPDLEAYDRETIARYNEAVGR